MGSAMVWQDDIKAIPDLTVTLKYTNPPEGPHQACSQPVPESAQYPCTASKSLKQEEVSVNRDARTHLSGTPKKKPLISEALIPINPYIVSVSRVFSIAFSM